MKNISKHHDVQRKYIVWGIALMLAIAPFLSFAIGLTKTDGQP
ncbi:hypothetical protein V7134_22420 [Priestia megaterium]